MLSKENYYFTKKLYWDLIIHYKKKNDEKSVEFFQKSWQEIEALYVNFDFNSIIKTV